MGNDFNFLTKKRGKKGNGRATVFKAVQLPVDIIDELKLYRDVYGFLQSRTKDSEGYPTARMARRSAGSCSGGISQYRL